MTPPEPRPLDVDAFLRSLTLRGELSSEWRDGIEYARLQYAATPAAEAGPETGLDVETKCVRCGRRWFGEPEREVAERDAEFVHVALRIEGHDCPVCDAAKARANRMVDTASETIRAFRDTGSGDRDAGVDARSEVRRGTMSDHIRAGMVAMHGEAVVADLEAEVAASVPWPCRDTMDGRRWCRVHDASWPSFTGTGCVAWLRDTGSGDRDPKANR